MEISLLYQIMQKKGKINTKIKWNEYRNKMINKTKEMKIKLKIN